MALTDEMAYKLGRGGVLCSNHVGQEFCYHCQKQISTHITYKADGPVLVSQLPPKCIYILCADCTREVCQVYLRRDKKLDAAWEDKELLPCPCKKCQEGGE